MSTVDPIGMCFCDPEEGPPPTVCKYDDSLDEDVIIAFEMNYGSHGALFDLPLRFIRKGPMVSVMVDMYSLPESITIPAAATHSDHFYSTVAVPEKFRPPYFWSIPFGIATSNASTWPMRVGSLTIRSDDGTITFGRSTSRLDSTGAQNFVEAETIQIDYVNGTYPAKAIE